LTYLLDSALMLLLMILITGLLVIVTMVDQSERWDQTYHIQLKVLSTSLVHY